MGAEIIGADLANLDDVAFAEIEQALYRFGAIVIRDQSLTHVDQIRFAQRFGTPEVHPIVQGLDDHPEIIKIHKAAGDPATFGVGWHSDNSFTERPSLCSIVYAESRPSAQVAYDRFLKKWKKLWNPVARSLAEAGPELLTFYGYPESQWKSLRTTNAIERINGEFKRRTKTQGAFSTESSVLVVLFGLVASGMIRLRKIPGYRDMPARGPELLKRST